MVMWMDAWIPISPRLETSTHIDECFVAGALNCTIHQNNEELLIDFQQMLVFRIPSNNGAKVRRVSRSITELQSCYERSVSPHNDQWTPLDIDDSEFLKLAVVSGRVSVMVMLLLITIPMRSTLPQTSKSTLEHHVLERFVKWQQTLSHRHIPLLMPLFCQIRIFPFL